MESKTLTQKRLKELLDYNQKTGVFVWIKPTSNRVSVGKIAGRKNGNGYVRINIDGNGYYAHRLSWLYVYGNMPHGEVDHIDGNGMNNAISNLRLATHAENGQNQPLRVTNTTGAHGVSFSKLHGKYESYIWVGGKKIHLGLFASKSSAKKAYLDAKLKLHNFQPVPRDLINA